MVALVPDPAAAAKRAVHRAGEANSEAAKSTRQRLPVLGLDQQVDVVFLDGEFENPEVRARRRSESAADDGEDPSGT